MFTQGPLGSSNFLVCLMLMPAYSPWTSPPAARWKNCTRCSSVRWPSTHWHHTCTVQYSTVQYSTAPPGTHHAVHGGGEGEVLEAGAVESAHPRRGGEVVTGLLQEVLVLLHQVNLECSLVSHITNTGLSLDSPSVTESPDYTQFAQSPIEIHSQAAAGSTALLCVADVGEASL